MVEQPPLRTQQGEQVGGVHGQHRHPDVLGHADARDRVVRAVGDVAVVLDADVDQVGDALGGHPLLGVGGLLLRQGDADDLDAVRPGRMQREGAPTATDVQHAHAFLQAELAGDVIALGELGRAEVVHALTPVGAGVRHRLAQHHLIEVVADVVVMGDRLGIAVLAVLATAQAHLFGRGLGRWPDHTELEHCPHQRLAGVGVDGHRHRLGTAALDRVERLERCRRRALRRRPRTRGRTRVRWAPRGSDAGPADC